jgi:hypothetical protein
MEKPYVATYEMVGGGITVDGKRHTDRLFKAPSWCLRLMIRCEFSGDGFNFRLD